MSITIRPSSLPRIACCPASYTVAGKARPRPEGDDAREGTAAHWVAEMVLSGQAPDTVSLVDRFAPNGVCITNDMAEYVDTYVDYVSSLPGARYVEVSVAYNLTTGVDVVGTGDCVVYDESTSTLYVKDFKYGYRLVEPGWQLWAYAFGICIKLGIKPITVVMSIVQPRPYHPDGKVRSITASFDELNHKFNEMVVMVSEALLPTAPMKTGSHCGNCDGYLECPAAYNAVCNAIDVVMQGSNTDMPPAAVGMELLSLNAAKEVITTRLAALESATVERIRGGTTIPGWDVKPSYGHTRWNDGIDPKVLEVMTGKELTTTKLVTPAAAKRLGVPDEMVINFTYRPVSGHKLVKVDVNKAAAKMFGK